VGQQEAGPARAGLLAFGGLGNCSVRFGFVCAGTAIGRSGCMAGFLLVVLKPARYFYESKDTGYCYGGKGKEALVSTR